jgi:hypothetical protein
MLPLIRVARAALRAVVGLRTLSFVLAASRPERERFRTR